MSSATTLSGTGALGPFAPQYGHFIDGQWRQGASGRTIAQINPATGVPLAEIQAGGPADVEAAVAAAGTAFAAWAATPAQHRTEVLHEIARRMKARIDEFARMESLNNGKTITEARHFDLPLAIDLFDFYAATTHLARRGETTDLPGSVMMLKREPVGVCAQIIPWNVPLIMTASKVAPALAMGNTVVLKPAETTCLSVLEWAREIQDLLPPGVLNIVTGYGPDVGEALVGHPAVRKVSFTGSTATARKVMQYASKNLIPQTLELGGKSAQIVCQSANLDQAVEGVVASTILNKGEVCLAGSRVFVHEAVKDAFVEKLCDAIRRVRIGDPLNPATQLGAQASRAQFEKVQSYLRIAAEEGARFLTGGRAATSGDLARGFYIEPTILDGVTNAMRSSREEIFGPVTSLFTWRDEAEVVRQANDSPFGLGGGIWSRDLAQAHRLAAAMDTGVVWINRYYDLRGGVPFGGVKQSGFGREGGYEILDAYTVRKTVMVCLDDNPIGLFGS